MLTRIADKYDVIKKLGSGSYGDVYLVHHAFLGTPYALKILNASMAQQGRLVERFKQEAEILERFSHPGSIQLRDFGLTGDGCYYMTMDYCEGKQLSEYIRDHGRFSFSDTLDIIEQILDVVDAAHQVGIIHRDIKPDNIMIEVGAEGKKTIKILDFGVAKLKERLATDSTATSEGAAIGTPFYMSPEQAAGQGDLDHRTDLYAIGIVLYELLTGDVPFRGETVVQTLLMHITRPAAPFAAGLGLPLFFEEMVFQAICKDRIYRYQDAAEFLADIAKAKDLLVVRAESKKSVGRQTLIEGEVNPSLVGESYAATEVKRTKILCLDDNEMILQILKYILEQAGYEVYTATNFSIIHPYIFTQEAALLLCDVQMPGLPGTKVCQMLKQSKRDLKIMLFSNLPERELERLSQECKADDWLSKNVSPPEWLIKIKEVLDRKIDTNRMTSAALAAELLLKT